MISIKLFDGVEEKEIDENKLYSFVSTEYCFPIEGGALGGDDFKKVYKWFKPKNAEYVKVGSYRETRDTLIDYLRKIEELKAGKYYNADSQKMRIMKENSTYYYDKLKLFMLKK